MTHPITSLSSSVDSRGTNRAKVDLIGRVVGLDGLGERRGPLICPRSKIGGLRYLAQVADQQVAMVLAVFLMVFGDVRCKMLAVRLDPAVCLD
jgi:hypothetical protein